MNKAIRAPEMEFFILFAAGGAGAGWVGGLGGKVSASGDVSEIYQSEDEIIQSHSRLSLSRRGRNWASGRRVHVWPLPPPPQPDVAVRSKEEAAHSS